MFHPQSYLRKLCFFSLLVRHSCVASGFQRPSLVGLPSVLQQKNARSNHFQNVVLNKQKWANIFFFGLLFLLFINIHIMIDPKVILFFKNPTNYNTILQLPSRHWTRTFHIWICQNSKLKHVFWNHLFLQINQKQEAFVEWQNPGTCRSLDLPPTQYHFNGWFWFP